MRSSRLALSIAFGYTLIAGLLTYYGGYVDGVDSVILSYILFPVSLPIILGIMSGSGIAILIFLVISLLLQWLVFFIIIKLVKPHVSKTNKNDMVRFTLT